MGKIQVSGNLLKRLTFISKHASKVLVAPNGVSSRHITVQSVGISDCTFGIESKELVEMLKHTQEFELVPGIEIKYSYSCNMGEYDAIVTRNIPVFDLQFTFDFQTPICTIKLPIFKSISNDETEVVFSNGKLVLETKSYIKTRLVFASSRVEGIESFCTKVRGNDLKIIEEIEGDRVLCYFEHSLVIFGFDKDISIAVVIKCIS